MKIPDLLNGKGPIFSFEFFPPKTPQGEQSLFETIARLRELSPAFVSVTCGAGGAIRDQTVAWVTRIKHEIGIEAMAHLTCVGSTADQLAAELDQLHANGIENVLALRGDPPRDQPNFQRPAGGFGFAAELVAFIRARGYPFALGGAGYPEGHLDCRDLDRDLAYLKAKVDAGLEFIITQLFFDSADYFAFVNRARAAGIHLAIIPGIMPITNRRQIERMAIMCGARIPEGLRAQLAAAGDDDAATRTIGIEHALAQCRDLLAHGAPGIHFYTLNQSPATRSILAELRR
ncbi:MAG TPA: methylenetetrahydrofolate reductase [NAD(P)H] [Candidatus Binatia bacterium]|nr:methylenetetrahydrofolate reductase [NAD(P)H] [Candidatus Binatia bacterium]